MIRRRTVPPSKRLWELNRRWVHVVAMTVASMAITICICPPLEAAANPIGSLSTEQVDRYRMCFMNIGPNSLADAESMIDAIGTRPAREALEIRRFCDEWYGYHVRSIANTSIEAGLLTALLELRGKDNWDPRCLARAASFLDPWQRQQVIESRLPDRLNVLFSGFDRKRLLYRDSRSAEMANKCHTGW
jgi:hypothetical protein